MVELAEEVIPEVPLAVASNGSSPDEYGAHFGWWDQRDAPDMAEAQRICDEFSVTHSDAALMLTWLQTRCAAMVQSERFQALVGMIASVLLDRGELDGALATHLLERRDTLIALDERTR